MRDELEMISGNLGSMGAPWGRIRNELWVVLVVDTIGLVFFEIWGGLGYSRKPGEGLGVLVTATMTLVHRI